MDLLEYITDMGRRNALADAIGTNPDWLWQIAKGWKGKRASKVMALAIERETAGAVPKESLRPDLWPTPGTTRKKRKAA